MNEIQIFNYALWVAFKKKKSTSYQKREWQKMVISTLSLKFLASFITNYNKLLYTSPTLKDHTKTKMIKKVDTRYKLQV